LSILNGLLLNESVAERSASELSADELSAADWPLQNSKVLNSLLQKFSFRLNRLLLMVCYPFFSC
jgi:hypothetical protein